MSLDREISMQPIDWRAPTISEIFYRCLWCGMWGYKYLWWPGTVCPHCHTKAPLAHEWHSALKHRFIDGVWVDNGDA